MAMEYRWDGRDGELIRFNRKRDIHEGYNWKQHKWEECPEAFDDRYFINGVKELNVTTGNYNMQSLLKLVQFYEENNEKLEKTRENLKVYDLPYPQMKLLDMAFWEIGFEKDKTEE